MAVGFKTENPDVSKRLATIFPNNMKSQAALILLTLAGKRDNGGGRNPLNDLLLFRRSTVAAPKPDDPSARYVVTMRAPNIPGRTVSGVFAMDFVFPDKALADHAAAGFDAAPATKVMVVAIHVSSVQPTLDGAARDVLDAVRACGCLPNRDFVHAVLRCVETGRRMPGLADRVADTLETESYRRSVLFARMAARYTTYLSNGGVEVNPAAAAAVAALKCKPDFTFPTLSDGTPISSMRSGGAVLAAYLANEERCMQPLPFLGKLPPPLKPKKAGKSAYSLLFTQTYTPGRQHAGSYENQEAAQCQLEQFEAAGAAWWADLLTNIVCSEIRDPADRTPTDVGAVLARHVPKWGGTLDERTEPVLSCVLELVLACPPSFDLAPKGKVQEALAAMAAGLGTVTPRLAFKAKSGYLHERLTPTLTLTLADVGVTGDLAAALVVPRTDGNGSRSNLIACRFCLVITLDALLELKDVPGGAQFNVRLIGTEVVIQIAGLTVHCGNFADVSAAEAFADALRNAPQAAAARVVLDAALRAFGLDAVAAACARVEIKCKLDLHDDTVSYLAEFLALTLDGVTADQLQAAMARARVAARSLAARVASTSDYRHDSPEWVAWKKKFAKAYDATVKKKSGPLCAVCNTSYVGVGLWNDDEKKPIRSCVVRGGKELDACLDCSFFHNSPAIVEAKKKAQRMVTKMNTPEGEEEECKRIDEEAAVKGIDPLDFIIPFE